MKQHARHVLAVFALTLVTPLALTPALAQTPPTAPAAEKAPATLNLGSDIDVGLRWLRYAQDATSGAYGGSVDTTALVLRALIQSPRKYQRIDGPFVQKALDYLLAKQSADGSIHDEGADVNAIRVQTSRASAALALHAHVTTGPALEKALKFLGNSSQDASIWNDDKFPESRDELIASMKTLVAKRNIEGFWDGPAGKVAETAQAVMTLVRAQPILKPADPKPPAPKPLPTFEPADRERALAAIEKGALWLSAQGEKGLFGAPGKPDAGMTAMALGGLLSMPEPRSPQVQGAIDQGLVWLLTQQKPDGSIHQGRVANYTTSAAIMALTRAKNPEYKPVIEKARDWIVALQVGAEEGYSADHPYYGGIGYGSSERPDLSNLQMALEALSDSGLSKDHEAFQRALKFLERCQNRSEANDIKIPDGSKVIQSGDDGGSAYAPGQSFAGFVELEGGKKVPRSYGSMTYALLKGYAFAGLPKEDPRMKAAFGWVSKNYTLDVNPGFEASADPAAAYQGLYYYFHTMAKALDLYGDDTITDAQGKAHSWRKDLAGRLVGLQSKNGSWINENSERWFEGNPQLATAYALMSLGLAAK